MFGERLANWIPLVVLEAQDSTNSPIIILAIKQVLTKHNQLSRLTADVTPWLKPQNDAHWMTPLELHSHPGVACTAALLMPFGWTGDGDVPARED